MENIYIYRVDLKGASGASCPNRCEPGYTIWIDEKLDDAHAMKAYLHEMQHIEKDDFNSDDVQHIECEVRK
ncbi:MAG: hypothetical protein Q4B26_10950 [Eubacteriales bacterium]|nr:hypothetical protein [Eubacteriales bacterium]